jgi:insulysin
MATGYHNYSQAEDMGILVPKYDKRKFKHIVLPNTIEAVLIQDEKAKTGSAAISVASGSNNDPKDLPGLSHLLEHMLFLGSSAYPDHSELEKLLSIGGGYSNAYTAQDETNYYFVSGNKELEPAIEIFSWFFRDPLLESDSIQNEVQNVDSEHRKNVNDDNWRTMEILKNEADLNSSYHMFNTGTQETLWDIPLEKGVNMSGTLRHFYETHYSANLMKLVIIGNRTLDKLENMAKDLFTQVSNTFKIETK